MKIVFSCFSLISSRLGAEVSLTYTVHLLDPLYKVAEDFAGKVISGMIFVSVLSQTGVVAYFCMHIVLFCFLYAVEV
jgi:hypothetical protein